MGKGYNKIVYEHAIKQANIVVGELMAKFEDEWLTIYV